MGRPASRLRFREYTIPVILRLILGAGCGRPKPAAYAATTLTRW